MSRTALLVLISAQWMRKRLKTDARECGL